ncbi:MAG: cadmium-translocating P-type ATPase [Candidatus Eremiobacteraeota bacterium]|nr:cadmium-translocating P-type ATPase [Candidatus Eremiobacteraeota bacterium]
MRRQLAIALLAAAGLAVHGLLRWFDQPWHGFPLQAVVVLGGLPLLWDLLRKASRGQFGSDLLAGISIITSVCLDQWLAGAVVVLMLSGGEALEDYAVGRASSVLEALAKRLPQRAQRKRDGQLEEISLDRIALGDHLVVLPHQAVPVDGVVLEGYGRINEAYLTGEPYESAKVPGSQVLSGSINGETSLVIRADKLPQDSRYAKIMRVMQDSQQHRPQMRRLGDRLGAWYTPLGVGIALLAWWWSGQPLRFLSVLVIATPCPLLIAIPVAIIGSISLAARRGIIIRDPAVLERAGVCQTMILDKTGTLTYGRPELTEIQVLEGFERDRLLGWAASLERYSRHPLSLAVQKAAQAAGCPLEEATEISEPPGRGIQGRLGERRVALVGRKQLSAEQSGRLTGHQSGLEAILLVDGEPAACLQFRDQPRHDTAAFLGHLHGNHGFKKLMIVSGDRLREVNYLADQVGMTGLGGVTTEVHAGQSPEQKLAIVRAETERQATIYLGDGINDAPALTAATVGLAMGQHSEVTAEAAGAVILDSSLRKVDEFLHIGRRLRLVALQSALGGISLSLLGMLLAASGHLSPVQGAIGQELIDLAAVLNALRTSFATGDLSDYTTAG